MVRKNEGKISGFMGYTLSKSTRKIPDVNQGRTFEANHDRRHNVSFNGVYELNKAWSFGLSFVYNTGRPVTIPTGRYEMRYFSADYITERNGYRLPDYHRMDISATLVPGWKKQRRLKSKWTFAVYNVYNRKNPFSLFTEDRHENGEVVGKQARMIYLFPILPSITYKVEF